MAGARLARRHGTLFSGFLANCQASDENNLISHLGLNSYSARLALVMFGNAQGVLDADRELLALLLDPHVLVGICNAIS